MITTEIIRMGKSKKRDKFKYDEDEFKDETPVTLEEEKPIKETSTIKCPRGHFLSDKQWSNVRRTYFCNECLAEVNGSMIGKAA